MPIIVQSDNTCHGLVTIPEPQVENRQPAPGSPNPVWPRAFGQPCSSTTHF